MSCHIYPYAPQKVLKPLKLIQVSKRYYNAHALVDVTLSVVFEPPLMEGKFPDGVHPLVKHPKIIVSVPIVIHKGEHCNADYLPKILNSRE